MSFLSRWFKGAQKTYDPAQWTTIYSADQTERQLLASNKEWVFVAVDKVAKAVAAVRFKVMKYERNGDDEEVFDGAMVDFLDAPAVDFTGKDFIYLDTAYKELTGNAFWELLPGTKVAPLIPTAVRPKLLGQKLVGFKYHDGLKDRDLRLDQVLHDRYVDPRKPYWGVGKLEKIARWVDTSSYANEFLRLFFINGAQFGGFIKTEEESEERIKLIKAGLANDHTGVQNSHKIAVLPRGAEYQGATANMSDMQYRELDEQYRDKILAGFGVPKTLVGFTTDVNRASAEASEYIFAKYTVKPVVDDFLEFLNTKVAPLLDPSGKFYFACDEFVPENVEAKLKERELALNKQPYKTVNEIRAEEGLPPVANGDTIYSTPGIAIGEKPPAPIGNPAQKAKVVPRRSRGFERKELMLDGIVAKVAEIAAQIDPDEESHKSFVSRVDAHEKLIAGKVRDFNNRQEREVVMNVNRLTKAVATHDLFDMDAEVGVLIDFVGPLLKGLLTEQAVAEYLAQEFAGTFNTGASSLDRIVELAAKRLAHSYNDTTATLLKDALNDGLGAGESFGQLAERVRGVYAFSDSVRAEAVARTEAFYIANEGSREAYRQSGVVKSVRWYTAEDERVCEFCGPMHGRVVKVTETFFKKGETVEGRDGGTLSTDYRAIDVPPLHTNCRCFIRPEEIAV